MGHLALETCQSDGVSDEVPSKHVSSYVTKEIRFKLSETAKYPAAAKDVVGQIGKRVIVRVTLAGVGTLIGHRSL